MLVSPLAKVIVVLILALPACAAHADLAQLGDAWADVSTFGAWGQSRDQHEAEKALLRAQFEEQLQREKNVGQALVHTARIEQKASEAIFDQYLGQRLVLIAGTIDVLIAQVKQLVVDRAKERAVSSSFNAWFDSFVQGQDEQLRALVDLLKQTAARDDAAVEKAASSALVAAAAAKVDAEAAKKKLREAVGSAGIDSLTKHMQALLDVRQQTHSVVNDLQHHIRDLVAEMKAEDEARRTLCAPPPTLGVACDAGKCRYYSPDPAEPLPCNEITFLNAFPVSAVSAITENAASYREYSEFFVSLKSLGTERPVTLTAFESPKSIYGKDLDPASLLPPDFIPSGDRCDSIDKYVKRLREALSYMLFFKDADDRSDATRQNIAYSQGLVPLIDFWIQDFSEAAPTSGGCAALPPSLHAKLDVLIAAVFATESFGSALTNGPASVTDNRMSLEALERLANDY